MDLMEIFTLFKENNWRFNMYRFFKYLALFIFCTTLYAQDQAVDRLSVSFSDPSRPGFVKVNIICRFFVADLMIYHHLLTMMITIWAVRLMVHLIPRIQSGKEDFRYRTLRKKWGEKALWKSYTHIFIFQGFQYFNYRSIIICMISPPNKLTRPIWFMNNKISI